MDYNALRHFADSWGLLGMVLFFLGAVAFMFRPGARQEALDAAHIPLRDHADTIGSDQK